jgi:hypothetical protein
MEKRYELIKTELGENLIMFDENGIASGVPFDPANSDYQRYLNPEAEQSTTILPE